MGPPKGWEHEDGGGGTGCSTLSLGLGWKGTATRLWHSTAFESDAEPCPWFSHGKEMKPGLLDLGVHRPAKSLPNFGEA